MSLEVAHRVVSAGVVDGADVKSATPPTAEETQVMRPWREDEP